MEAEYIAPETIQPNFTEENSSDNHEGPVPKDLSLWCLALKITPEEYNAMSDKELVLRINNLKGKLKLKLAKTLIARQKEQLDRIRARLSKNDDNKSSVNEYAFRQTGGEETFLEKSFDELFNNRNFNTNVEESIHSILPKVLRANRKKNDTDVWKGICKAATDIERMYSTENNQGLNNINLDYCADDEIDDEEYNEKDNRKNCNKDILNNNVLPRSTPNGYPSTSKKSFRSNATQQIHRNLAISKQTAAGSLQYPKVIKNEWSTTSDQVEFSPQFHLNIKRSPERCRFASKGLSLSPTEDRPHIEAAIIIEDEEINDKFGKQKQEYQKNDNLIEVQSIKSYEIEGNSSHIFHKTYPYQNSSILYENQSSESFSQINSLDPRINILQGNSSEKQKEPRQMKIIYDNENFDDKMFNIPIQVVQNGRIYNKNSDDNKIYRNLMNSSEKRPTEPVRGRRNYENISDSRNMGNRIKLSQDNQTTKNSIDFHEPGRKFNNNHHSRIRVIQDNGHTIGIKNVENHPYNNDNIEYQSIDRSSRPRHRKA